MTLSFSHVPSHDNIPLACDGCGQGSPLLLFIHGWTCRRNYWQPQLDAFANRYRVAALDLPGHGDSGTGNRSRWDIASFALDIVACVRELQSEQVILIGHSMGGAVALEAARLLGDRVSGVIVVDTFIIDYGGLTADTIAAIVAPFEEDFTKAMAALVAQTSTAETPIALQQRLVRDMAAADPAWAVPLWRDLLAWNPQPAFVELQVPIHAINGALIPETARQRCAPFLTETLIPGAGHFLQMEDPEKFNQILDPVLTRIG